MKRISLHDAADFFRLRHKLLPSIRQGPLSLWPLLILKKKNPPWNWYRQSVPSAIFRWNTFPLNLSVKAGAERGTASAGNSVGIAVCALAETVKNRERDSNDFMEHSYVAAAVARVVAPLKCCRFDYIHKNLPRQKSRGPWSKLRRVHLIQQIRMAFQHAQQLYPCHGRCPIPSGVGTVAFKPPALTHTPQSANPLATQARQPSDESSQETEGAPG